MLWPLNAADVCTLSNPQMNATVNITTFRLLTIPGACGWHWRVFYIACASTTEIIVCQPLTITIVLCLCCDSGSAQAVLRQYLLWPSHSSFFTGIIHVNIRLDLCGHLWLTLRAESYHSLPVLSIDLPRYYYH